MHKRHIVTITLLIQTFAQADALVDGVWNPVKAQFIQDIGTTDQRKQVSDRKNHAGDSADMSGAAADAHAGIGAGLLGAGIPMTFVPIVPVAVAGWILVGDGIAELAQSGADRSVQKQNEDQRQLLSRDKGDTGQSLTPNQAATPQLPEAIENQLRQNGVNPDAFLKSLVSGQLNNPEDLIRAAGLGDKVSAADLAEGARLASEKSQGVNNTAELKSMELDSRPKGIIGGAVSGSGSSLEHPQTQETAKSRSEEFASKSVAPIAPKMVNLREGMDAAKELGAPFDASFLQNLLGKPGETDPEILAWREQVFARGVQAQTPGQNIFDIARRNYRSFSKWRAPERSTRAIASAQR